MIAFVRLLLVVLALQTILYVGLSIYSRGVRRRKLEAEWEEDIGRGDREAFVEEGLKDYDASLRRRLLLGIYVVPLIGLGVIIYLNI